MKPRWVAPIAVAIAPPVIKTLAATWRYREVGGFVWKPPFIFVLWHSRLLPLLALHKHKDLVVLISRHRDGGYLADMAAGWGYRPVRGSTQRGGEVGLLGIVRALQAGAIVAITPDGPRGPAERVQPGAIAAAQHAGVPIIAVGANATSAWYLGSWDRMCIPRPFAAIDVRYGPPIAIGPGKDGLRRGIAAVQQSLHEVSGVGG
ncbi:MAG: lysophospholipid acyltransferase family protein [Gemmatimonadales bacterium]